MDTPRTDATMWSALPDAVPPPSFKTVKRGFDQNQVTDYITRLNERVRSHERQVRQLRQESEQIKRERDAALRERAELLQQASSATEDEGADRARYEQLSHRVTKILSGLDREVERIRAEAEAEAKQILEHARSEAYRVSREAEDARVAATRAAQRATKRAERSVSEMEARRGEVLKELRTTCSGFLEVVQNLAASIDAKGPVEQGNGSAPAEEPVVIPDVTPDTA